jgi:ABC-type sugar transport system ATPase subunit
MTSVELRNVHKKYGTVHAVQGISFECHENEFLVILGPSGAGKTSTLKMIAGLESVTDGEIYLDGRCINALPPEERRVAMVFETYALYPHLTVFENMAFPLKSKLSKLSKPDISQRIHETAEILQMSDLLERKPAELSGGQKQRVSLGRALVRKARLLLMDEPLSHLDAKLRHHMRRELRKYHSALNTTVIYVTHDYLEALALGDRIVVLNQGKIHQIGTPQEVYHSPADTFVASLLGYPKINLIPAVVQKSLDNAVQLAFEGGAAELLVFDLHQNRIDGSRDLTIGIRPQHIHLFKRGVESGVAGEVYVNQNVGVKNLVEVKVGPHLINVLCRDADYVIGEEITVQFPKEHVMLFDRESGKNFSK